jgi:uncharacterized protein (DUF1499 family)
MARTTGADPNAAADKAVHWAFPLPFERLALRPTPNQYLVLPPDFPSTAAAPHRRSPVFDVGVERLAAAWDAVIAEQPRVTPTRRDDAARQVEYVQRSRLFRFPDVITVKFIPLGPDRSTLAVYSRSRYGRRDFGVNRRRVEAWLARLSQELQAHRHDTG